ncbi:MAG TPA: hypothetical protein VFG03_14690, partial [Telluria sp.]|nr:hypothetical protein [Telluria sp.]
SGAIRALATYHQHRSPRTSANRGWLLETDVSTIDSTPHYAHSATGLADLCIRTWLYNHHIPQRAIEGQTPIQALKDWQHRRPELFVKRVYDRPGLDS